MPGPLAERLRASTLDQIGGDVGLQCAIAARHADAFLANIATASDRTYRGANVRDAAMDDNVEWLLRREGRIVIAAANGHLQRWPYRVKVTPWQTFIASGRLSVLGPTIRSMTRYVDEDLHGAEFRECDLTGARLIGVVMRDAVIDGLVTNLVVNGVEVTGYVEAELDRRHPVRVLIRSEDPAELRAAARQLQAAWAATIERIRRAPGIEWRSVNDEWSAVRTLRHLVFVHDSWFRRCCLGSTELFTPMGIGPTVEPYRGAHGLDLSLDPALDEIVRMRDAQAAELEAWLDGVTAEQLAARAPVPEDDVWPPYARGRSVRQCLGTVLNETFEHHGFCVRDLDLIEAQATS